MKKKPFLLMLTVPLALSAFLAACSSDSDTGSSEGSSNEAAQGEQIEGGTLTYGMESPPEGLFSTAFYGSAVDFDVIQYFDESLFDYDENLQIQPGIASWETEDNKVYTFKIKEGVMWHNGEELTVNDWVFALETIANPDYDGSRYANVQTIEGAPAYNAGEADSISGLNVIDDYTLEITFDEARVNNLLNVWSYPLPEKHFEGVEVADMSASPQVRQNPVGLGPFKVTNIVQGESVQYEKFADYWQGEPILDGIVLKVIDSSTVVGALETGDIDMIDIAPVNGEEVSQLENVTLTEWPGLSYYYVGFKLGTFNNETKEITEDREKYSDLKLRQAMAHAINRQEWIDAFFFGYGQPVDGPVPSNHWIAADSSELTTYEYDVDKAKALLDEAGYKDVNGDGFVEDPEGNEFVAKFSHYQTTNPTFEARAQAIGQYWEDAGIKTEVEMVEFSLYYDQIETDNEAMETFFGGWGTGTDPDPTALWASDQIWNYPRYKNEQSDQLLKDALNIDLVGDDDAKRKEIYVEWQKLISDDLPMIFIAELSELTATNNRVGGVTYDVSGKNGSHEWFLTEE